MKQVIIARSDLKMSPGKLAAQVAHASLIAYENACAPDITEWKRSGFTKVVLEVESERDLLYYYKIAVALYLPASLICDEGRTEVTPGTFTAVAIGPVPKNKIDTITGDLKLYGKKE